MKNQKAIGVVRMIIYFRHILTPKLQGFARQYQSVALIKKITLE